MTKAQTIARKQERNAKPSNYFSAYQAQQAADESNARYGFRVDTRNAKTGR
jgi:hypothetical protein